MVPRVFKISSMWKTIQDTILNPKVDDAVLESRMREIRGRLPTPVFWLLGKAQSGKTSVIRAITGDSRAEIGDGIRPCTRTAYVYDFPSREDGFVKFLDTRGLGEIDYDPAEDIAAFQNQAHVLVVVLKAMDHAQQPVIEAVREIAGRRPHWPIIVVQTTLHEGYGGAGVDHIQPYPYAEIPLADAIPADLTRSLLHQREMFKGLNAAYVAVDLTLPEDGFEPPSYGGEALWDAIEYALPKGVAVVIRQAKQARKDLHDVYSRAAHPHIISYALIAGAAGALPVPLVDVPLVTAIQAKLLQTIASLYDCGFDRRTLSELGSALGVSFAVSLGRRQVTKLIPLYGAAVSSLATAATTYALGKTLGIYFSYMRAGGSADPKILRATYAEQFKLGKHLLREYFNTMRHNGRP